MDKLAIAVGVFFITIAVLFVLSSISAIPIWLLWNAVIPDIFGLPTITFLQAWGLSILCSLLFKTYSYDSGKK